MTYRLDSMYAGYPAIEEVIPVPVDPPRGLPISPGFICRAEDPVWGPGEFIFARAGAGIALYKGTQFLPVWDATNKVFTYNMTEWAATANSGIPYYVYQGNRAALVGEYAWFQMTGRSPVNGTSTIAAGVKGSHAAAGQLAADGATLSLNNAIVVTPATQTVVSAGSGLIGDTRINLVSTDGFFVGGYVSGTGVGAAAIVSAVNPNGKFILVTVVNSAAVTGNVTITYNNATIFYNVLEFNRMGGVDVT